MKDQLIETLCYGCMALLHAPDKIMSEVFRIEALGWFLA